jgi:hypothetical protein
MKYNKRQILSILFFILFFFSVIVAITSFVPWNRRNAPENPEDKASRAGDVSGDVSFGDTTALTGQRKASAAETRRRIGWSITTSHNFRPGLLRRMPRPPLRSALAEGC